jgi:hypothetical protein
MTFQTSVNGGVVKYLQLMIARSDKELDRIASDQEVYGYTERRALGRQIKTDKKVKMQEGLRDPIEWLKSDTHIPLALKYWTQSGTQQNAIDSDNHYAQCRYIYECCEFLYEVAGRWNEPSLKWHQKLKSYTLQHIKDYEVPSDVETMYLRMDLIWFDFVN